MGTALKQGEELALRQAEFDLSQVSIDLTWDPHSQQATEFHTAHVGILRHQEEMDLDAVAILLGADGKIPDLGCHDASGGRSTGDVVFHRAMQHGSGAIWLTADDRTGACSGHGEQIIVRLAEIPAHYTRIVFFVVIHEGRRRGQHFSAVANARIAAFDAKREEICHYDISNTGSFAQCCALKFAEVVRSASAGEWRFCAVGEGLASDRFVDLLQAYL